MNGDTMTIKHPIPKKINHTTIPTTKSNLGMDLEVDIEITNQYYLDTNRAFIYKKPTPIQVVNVSYPKRSMAKITEAYYKTPSTTDFNGIYKGYYIDFDCKMTKSKTSIPLSNIHPHQMRHLENIVSAGGIGFLIVLFSAYDEYYLLPFNVLKRYYDASLKDGRKSIPYQTFKKEAYLIHIGYHPRVDYLSVLDSFVLPDLKPSQVKGI